MVAYNFDQGQARDIIFGLKTSALKPDRKSAHVVEGGLVHAFCGNVPPDYTKSPDCHRLMTAPCVRSSSIQITTDHAVVDGVIMTNPEWYRTVALGEGYSDFGALQADYDRRFGLPWSGQYFRWNPAKAEFRGQWPLIVKPPEPVPEAVE
jgi:hypothetical protein